MEPVALKFIRQYPEFVVDWYIGRRCNLNCNYCGPEIHDNHSPHAKYEHMLRLVDKVCGLLGSNVLWSLTGGEPTLHPKLLDLCEYIKTQYGSKIGITTNGARNADYFLNLFPLVSSLVVSIHFEQIGNRLNTLIENIIVLEKWKKKWNLENPSEHKLLIIRLMAYPGRFDELHSTLRVLKSVSAERVEVRVIKGAEFDKNSAIKKPGYPDRYTLEEKNELMEHMVLDQKKNLRLFFAGDNSSYQDLNYNDLVINKQNSFKGWTCWAGLDHIKVNPEGEVFRGSCLEGGSLGNVYNDIDFKLPTQPYLCNKKYCGNILDLRSNKIKEEKFKELIN